MAEAENRRIPFEPKDLEGKIGTLYYIALTSEKYRVKIARDILAYRRTPGRRLHQALDALRGKDPRRVNNPREMYATEGAIIEVESLKPGGIEGWSLGDIRLAIFDDGTPVNAGIEGVYEDYIFALERPVLRAQRPPILVGQGHPFSLHDGEILPPLLRRIIVELADIPTYKSRGTICCLGGIRLDDSPVVQYARSLLAKMPAGAKAVTPPVSVKE